LTSEGRGQALSSLDVLLVGLHCVVDVLYKFNQAVNQFLLGVSNAHRQTVHVKQNHYSKLYIKKTLKVKT